MPRYCVRVLTEDENPISKTRIGSLCLGLFRRGKQNVVFLLSHGFKSDCCVSFSGFLASGFRSSVKPVVEIVGSYKDRSLVALRCHYVHITCALLSYRRKKYCNLYFHFSHFILIVTFTICFTNKRKQFTLTFKHTVR